jgi:hypothetical protein
MRTPKAHSQGRYPPIILPDTHSPEFRMFLGMEMVMANSKQNFASISSMHSLRVLTIISTTEVVWVPAANHTKSWYFLVLIHGEVLRRAAWGVKIHRKAWRQLSLNRRNMKCNSFSCKWHMLSSFRKSKVTEVKWTPRQPRKNLNREGARTKVIS